MGIYLILKPKGDKEAWKANKDRIKRAGGFYVAYPVHCWLYCGARSDLAASGSYHGEIELEKPPHAYQVGELIAMINNAADFKGY